MWSAFLKLLLFQVLPSLLVLAQSESSIRDNQTEQSASMVSMRRRTNNSFPISVGIFQGNITYYANVTIGSPPQTFRLMLHFASGTTWVGANTVYRSETADHLSFDVDVRYGFGSMTGEMVMDTMTLGPGLTTEVAFGNASNAAGFQDFDGVLGLGRKELTQGTIFPPPPSLFGTPLDYLFMNGMIPEPEVGVYYQPVRTVPFGAELTFGGIDEGKIVGPIIKVPNAENNIFKDFWTLNASIQYGGLSLTDGEIMTGIIDGGSAFTYLRDDIFQKYLSLTGAKLENNGYYNVSNFPGMQDLTFTVFGNNNITLVPDAQIWPRSQNDRLRSLHPDDNIYLAIGDLSGPSDSSSLAFILGYNFLERYYTAYDTADLTIIISPTSMTNTIVNSLVPFRPI
ncbi:hypothetical protein VKT23_008658 [Stygiomarasmius scandens]|uniref:Peptidase A1 domain-containing protein n=1 Tax=Marasmiellus scandens TaxID=2682957 RepID=A0ABR1JH12_9AGAR